MAGYVLRRLLLLPITLFCIVLVNFVIINLAPGEPALMMQINAQGDASRQEGSQALFGQDERYLQFREFFGLTLPILYNDWNWITKEEVFATLTQIGEKQQESAGTDYQAMRTKMGDQARFVLPHLVAIMQDEAAPLVIRQLARHYVLRGAHRFVYEGQDLTASQKEENRKIAENNLFLDHIQVVEQTKEAFDTAILPLVSWYEEHTKDLGVELTASDKLKQFFCMTRFAKYLFRVLRLDFGTTRNDPNRLVIAEVIRRLRYSLTLSLLPLVMTIGGCLILGMLMAIWKDSFFDRVVNTLLLFLYASPVFVVAPFLIEKVALHHNYPFTLVSFPIAGFSSPDSLYNEMTSLERLFDILRHITLPLVTILYGSFAMQARLSRAVFLDIIHQDYVRTARAKGVSPLTLYLGHVGRNGAIPIVTSVAGSLGVILGGSVIVETIFEIPGFGKFFYDAIVNRDYNVMMFSVLVGSFLALLGYLVADLMYMWLDPRVSLEKAR